ncbi:MAG: HAD-IA family hydrolase [Patescibacteria group bacterium]
MHTPITAAIFDLNGVFIVSPKLSDRFAEVYGVPQEQFLPALQHVLDVARMPNAGSSFALWKPYLDQWHVELSEQAFFDFWFSAEQENTAMIALARELKDRGMRLFVLSNNFRERTEYYRSHFPFLAELFTFIYFSWEQGYVKPDPRAWEWLIQNTGVVPNETLYMDDKEENCTVAASLGFSVLGAMDTEEIRKVVGIEG